MRTKRQNQVGLHSELVRAGDSWGVEGIDGLGIPGRVVLCCVVLRCRVRRGLVLLSFHVCVRVSRSCRRFLYFLERCAVQELR